MEKQSSLNQLINYKLTGPQKNIWETQKFYSESVISNICGVVFYDGDINVEYLIPAIKRFVSGQNAFGLQFIDEGEPKQVFSSVIDFDVDIKSFETMDDFEVFAKDEAQRPFIGNGQLFRFIVVVVKGRVGILAVLSHLISDAWSFGLMANGILEVYSALSNGMDEVPSFVLGDYREFINSSQKYYNSSRYKADAEYWNNKLSDISEIAYIKQNSGRNKSLYSERISLQIPKKIEQKIKDFCGVEKSVTEAILFETAYLSYLYHINDRLKRITIGIPSYNRTGKKEKSTVGMFVTTLPLSVELNEDSTISEIEAELTHSHAEIFRHGKYPYDELMNHVRKQGFKGDNLYGVIFSYQNMIIENKAETRWYPNGYSDVQFALHVDHRDNTDEHFLTVDYQTDVFTAKEAGLILNRIVYVLDQILESDSLKLKDISVIPKSEQELILNKWNDTYTDYRRDVCIHTLFEEQVCLHGKDVAIYFEDERITYQELNEKANVVAEILSGRGIGRNEIVPILTKRSPYYIIGLLGILKAGASFMPVVDTLPEDRKAFMISEANAKVCLIYGCEPVDKNVDYIFLDKLDYQSGKANLRINSDSDDSCYVIFTSGSTGKPKGVVQTHHNMVNFLSNQNPAMPFGVMRKIGSIMLSDSSFAFDASLFEIFFPLINGQGILLIQDIYDDEKKAELIARCGVDMMITTSTKLAAFMNKERNIANLKNMKVIIQGGEVFNEKLYERLVKYTDAEVYNGYGPTEITVGCNLKKIIIKNHKPDINIGSPIDNTQIYILDRNSKLCPIGVVGELCVAGEGVGKGYLNRPELNNDKFVINPFATKENGHGSVMYKTGDLARWNVDGELEFIGRKDSQVKIRGQRIELEEIEAVMNNLPDIEQSAVTDKKDETGRQYLVGYYVSSCEVDTESIRIFLRAKLPNYMIPNYYVRLSYIPITESGKINRKLLPDLNFERLKENRNYEEPADENEMAVAEIWKRLLEQNNVGRNDDFFELGGDSLIAIALVSELEELFKKKITVKNIFEHSVLSDLVNYLIKDAEVYEEIRPSYSIKNLDRYELMPQQLAIYLEYKKNPGSLSYNMPARVKLPKDIDIERLKNSINILFQKHKSLKTSFEEDGDKVYGVYHEDIIPEIEIYADTEINSFLRPFDLADAPLIRFGLTENSLLFDMHHIISDGASLSIMLEDIFTAYMGEEIDEVELDYAEYAKAYRSMEHKQGKEFFKNMLKSDYEPVILPLNVGIVSENTSVQYTLSQKYSNKAKDLAKRFGVTDTMFYLGLYGIILSDFSGRDDFITGLVCTNRTRSETKHTVGMFVNTLPVCLNPVGDIKRYFNDIRQKVLGIYDNQELSFIEISDLVGLKDKGVMNTSFIYQADGDKKIRLGDYELIPEWIDTKTSKFDLTMEVMPDSEVTKVRLEYSRDKYNKSLMDRLIIGLKLLIDELYELDNAYEDGAVTDFEESEILSQIDINKLCVLSEREKEKLLCSFNNSREIYDKNKVIHELFREQVKKSPDETALVFRGERFSYTELDKMSDSLAKFLLTKGISRGDIVPIVSRRSWHLIVAMLAVLKSGAAYMPVSPDLPEDRISYMFDVAGVKLALCFENNKALEIETINLKTFNYSEVDETTELIESEKKCKPDDLAYVVFTSGSTGRPKGVSINHSNVVNYCNNKNNNSVCGCLINGKCSSIISVTNIVFDIFVTESLLPLLNGITIYLADDEETLTQAGVAELIQKYDIDVLQTTPTKMRSYMLNNENLDYLDRLKVVILGGEALTSDICEKLGQNTHAVVYNIYGPAETTVWSTNHKVLKTGESYDLSIGRPIANTQIYILGKHQELLPFGVAGELCIAGDGVGAGYIGKPELTKERFLDNPFATAENGHGKVLYRTGDLARWREDGCLDYLGRIDTQVKIRGLRIELGEIESIMCEYPGIALAAVKDVKDESGRQYLVGYYTTIDDEPSINERKLRDFLLGKLTRYMVPNYFIKLDEIPVTPSGKIDRKNLPVPKINFSEKNYIPPENDTQKIFCDILESLYGHRVGIQDDFFADLGGDSLRAIEYMVMLKEKGFTFDLQDIFDYPSVISLYEHAEGIKKSSEKKSDHDDTDDSRGNGYETTYNREALKKYLPVLKYNVCDDITVEKKKLGTVLLTGATGFLGAHIMAELLEEGADRIFCLVRSRGGSAQERLEDTIHYYFEDKYNDMLNNRIIALEGDIEDDHLFSSYGVTGVDTIIHAAANVKHYGNYEDFDRINVQGTQNVINLAKKCNARLIHVSTMSVSGTGASEAFDIFRSDNDINFDESCLYVGQPLRNVYVKSKFEAECRIYDAVLDGLDAKVVRVGNLTNRISDYKFQKNYQSNAFLNRVCAILRLECIPERLMNLNVEFSPVDETARAIVRVTEFADKHTVFHIYSDKLISFSKLVKYMNDMGQKCEIVSEKEFADRLKIAMHKNESMMFYNTLANDLDNNETLAYETNIHLKNDYSISFLKQTGFSWSDIDRKYLTGYLNYLHMNKLI